MSEVPPEVLGMAPAEVLWPSGVDYEDLPSSVFQAPASNDVVDVSVSEGVTNYDKATGFAKHLFNL
jgi:hypothetical protein